MKEPEQLYDYLVERLGCIINDETSNLLKYNGEVIHSLKDLAATVVTEIYGFEDEEEIQELNPDMDYFLENDKDL